MELAVIDLAKLKLAQAATDGPWKPGLPSSLICHVIRIEPDGSVVGTNNVTLVHALDVVEPFEGEALHVIPLSIIPKAARTGSLSDGNLVTDKGTVELLWLDEASDPPLTSYPNYRRILERIGEGVEHKRGDYGWDHKRLDSLIKASPRWPKKQYVKLRHLSERSVALDLGVEGVTALLSLTSGTAEDVA